MSIVTRTTVAILIVAAIAPVAAAGQTGSPATGDRAGSHGPSASGERAVLRRDGDRAVPFDPAIGSGEAPVLRRDGSQAVPFAAVGARGGVAEDGFDWGDAAIGAAGAVGLMLLASVARAAARRRRPTEPRQTVTA